jgi:CheY-like chemotaxis protein
MGGMDTWGELRRQLDRQLPSVRHSSCRRRPASSIELREDGGTREAGGMNRARVAVIDDEPELLGLVGEILESEGFSVQAFTHPASVAPLMHREARPDLFLVDIMLPRITGIDLASLLNENGFARTPKIAMSASPERLEEARRSGLFQLTLEKPFDVRELLTVVGNACPGLAPAG